MPFTARSGLRIHYEISGAGPPLVLLHGLMGSVEWWQMAGYVDALVDDFQVVTIDARGHGRSDIPHEPEVFRVPHKVADVLAVLDELEIATATVCGWSLGGDTALAIASLEPVRVRAVVAIGAFGYGVGFDDTPRLSAGEISQAAQGFEKRGMADVAQEFETAGRPMWADLVRQADPQAMAARTRMLLGLPSIRRRLRDLTPPLLLIWGSDEQPPKLPLPKHAIVMANPGANHLEAFMSTNLVVGAIRRFLIPAGARSSTR
jgi:pimeloyl-ACP methyl ester carboxylesterase